MFKKDREGFVGREYLHRIRESLCAGRVARVDIIENVGEILEGGLEGWIYG